MEKFKYGKILPAVTLEDPGKAFNVGEAILKGGIKVMEITFRTSRATDAIRIIKKNLPAMVIGAGTLLTKEDIRNAKDSGAEFGLSPGFDSNLIEESYKIGFPYIPGVMTPGEIQQSLNLGCEVLKVFPAEQLGGINFMKSLFGPFGHTGVSFIPMGGINIKNIEHYNKLGNVVSMGGSWIAPGILIEKGEFETITENARSSLHNLTSPPDPH